MGEFLERSARLDELLATLAGKLNSNESFDPQRGFQVDIVFVSIPTPGSGCSVKCNVGRCLDKVNKQNTCARAIITMRAQWHKHEGVVWFSNVDNLKRGRPVQTLRESYTKMHKYRKDRAALRN